jgi:hypothetical protein
MTRKIALMTFLTLSLTGCLEEGKPVSQATQCFDMLQSKDELRPIMFNKCTGETWMLTRTQIVNNEGIRTGQFTYRWGPLAVQSDEPLLSYSK